MFALVVNRFGPKSIENMLYRSGLYVISTNHQKALHKVKLHMIDLIFLNWPQFTFEDLEYCKAIRDYSNAPVYVIGKSNVHIDKERLKRDNIYFYQEVQCSVGQCKIGDHGLNGIKEKNKLRLNPLNRTVLIEGKEIDLSRKEFSMLEYMYSRAESIIEREEMIAELWDGVAAESNVYVTVQKLRRKIEKDPRQPEFIITKKGGGYMLTLKKRGR